MSADAVQHSSVKAEGAELLFTTAKQFVLGLRDSAAFGRIVSGQLPISAIPALDTLESVAFVRAATMRLSPGPRQMPRP